MCKLKNFGSNIKKKLKKIGIGKKLKNVGIGIGKAYLGMVLFSLRLALVATCIMIPIGCIFGTIPGWVFWLELVLVITGTIFFKLRKS